MSLPSSQPGSPGPCSNLTAPYRYFNGDDELGVLAQFYGLPWLSGRTLLWNLASELQTLRQACWLAWVTEFQ